MTRPLFSRLTPTLCGAATLAVSTAAGAQTGYYFSTGDNQQIGHHMPLDSEATLAATFDLLQDVYGVQRIYWRGLQATQVSDGLIRQEAALTAYHFNWQSDLMDRESELNRTAVQLAHDRGMEIWGEAALFDWGSEGTDSTNLLGWPGITESNLRLDNPDWVPVDRFGVRQQSGPIEFGYADARDAVANWVHTAATDVGYDGVIFHTFAENYSTQYADEFGFNDPVVTEFQNLYGVDIRREAFDVQALRNLRGTHTTAFLQTLRTRLNAEGIDLAVALNGADADQPMAWLAGDSPFPLAGTMTMHWQQWVDLGLVDELQLGQNYTAADSGVVINYAQGSGVSVSALAQNPYSSSLDPLKVQGVSAVGTGTTLEEFMRNSPIPVQLIGSLNSADPYERMRVLGQIIDGDTPATAAQISPLLNDANVLVRRMALKALGASGDPAAVPLLEDAMFDPDTAISTAAAYALRLGGFDIGEPTVTKIIAAMVQSEAPPFLEAAMGTMLSMGVDTVTPMMVDTLANHANVDARRLAARTLWNFSGGPNNAELRQTLIDALGDPDPFVRYYAAAMHGQINPSSEMVTALLDAARSGDTVVASQATDSLGRWLEIGYANAVGRKAELTAVLDALFAEYGDGSTRSNADWGFEVIGRSLLAAGAEGEQVLRQHMTQREDRLLSERAWSILFFPNSRGEFDLRTFEESEYAYLRRPRWEAVTAMADAFDSGFNGQRLDAHTPDTGMVWEVLYGEPELQVLQDAVARDGLALELRRPLNTTLSHGVRMSGHLYDTAVAELTQVTVSADWLRPDDDTFAWLVLDVGHANIHENPAVIAHTTGTYWVTSAEGTIDTGVAIGSEGWETLEILVTWGVAEGDTVEGAYDVYLTREAGNTLGELERVLIASNIAIPATDLASMQRLTLLNDAHVTVDAVTYWDNIAVRVLPIPEPATAGLLLLCLLTHRHRQSWKG